MFYKSILFLSISLQLFTLHFPIFADVTKKTSDIKQHIQSEVIEDKVHTADEKVSTTWDKASEYGIMFAKGAFYYVVIGGTVFVVAAGSLTLHMLLQLYSRNP